MCITFKIGRTIQSCRDMCTTMCSVHTVTSSSRFLSLLGFASGIGRGQSSRPARALSLSQSPSLSLSLSFFPSETDARNHMDTHAFMCTYMCTKVYVFMCLCMLACMDGCMYILIHVPLPLPVCRFLAFPCIAAQRYPERATFWGKDACPHAGPATCCSGVRRARYKQGEQRVPLCKY